MPVNKVLDKSGKPVKKDGKVKYRVRINYTDSYGKAKQIERTAYGADEAKQLERELLYKLKQETPARKITVQQLYDEYINAKKHEVKESSLAKKKCVIETHVLPTLSNYKLDKLNIQVLQKWKQEIETLGLSIRMRKNIFSEFRTLLNFAVKMEYIAVNPLLKVGNFKAPLERSEEMKFYTPDEFKLFITEAKEEVVKTNSLQAWGFYIFFMIAFFCGMRKGEINALNWNDCKNGQLDINKSVTQKLSGGDRITAPKNKASVRKIQIPEPLQIALDDYYNVCKNTANFTDDYFICGGLRPLRDTSIENANSRFAEKAGVKKIRIHDFRHSHASLLVNNGINIQEVARRLGHADVSITLRTYSHLYPAESERALNVLNKVQI